MVPEGLIPSKYDWVIAGGYAACPSLASDIDVWVMVGRGIVESTQKALQHRYQKELELDAFGNIRSFTIEDACDEEVAENDYSYPVPIENRRVGKVVTWSHDTPYHIIVTDGGVREILGAFDVSTHQIAIRPSGEIIKGPGWTSVAEEPYRLRSNVHTAARMAKIRNRYKHYAQEAR